MNNIFILNNGRKYLLKQREYSPEFVMPQIGETIVVTACSYSFKYEPPKPKTWYRPILDFFESFRSLKSLFHENPYRFEGKVKDIIRHYNEFGGDIEIVLNNPTITSLLTEEEAGERLDAILKSE